MARSVITVGSAEAEVLERPGQLEQALHGRRDGADLHTFPVRLSQLQQGAKPTRVDEVDLTELDEDLGRRTITGKHVVDRVDELDSDRDVEIVADRGFNGLVSAQEWAEVCRVMEQSFARGSPRQAIVDGIRAVGVLVARHFPTTDRDELPNRPVLL